MLSKHRKKSTKFFLLLLILLLLTAVQAQKAERIDFSRSFELSNKELAKLFPIKNGQNFNKQHLINTLRVFEKELRNQGFLYARVDSVRLQPLSDSTRVVIRVYGRSGLRTYLGRISLISDSLPASKYRQELTLQKGEVFRPQAVDENIRRLLQLAADHGFPFAQAQVDSVRFTSGKNRLTADVRITVHEHRPVFIKDILISGNSYTKDRVILRELSIYPGARYSEKQIHKVPQQLERLGIFKSVSAPELIKVSQDSVIIQITIEEGNATMFNGVVGYIPQPAQNLSGKSGGYFTGLIDLSFKNLFGTARKFMVHWKKVDQFSEDFNFAYTEPWVFNFPIDLNFGLNRVVRDTTYIEWSNFIGSDLRLFPAVRILFSIRKKTIIPDSAASRDLRLPRSNIWHGEVGLVYDTRDYLLNPTRGFFLKNSYSSGVKEITGPDYLLREDSLSTREILQTLALDAEGYLNVWRNQVAAVAVHLRQIKGEQLNLSDYFWFGGSRSLRGYRENQFAAPLVSWVNLEYRFLLSKNSRLFLFNDWGYYQTKIDDATREELLYGYGLGIRLETPLGILGVDYGLGKGDSFSQGKIHFGLINTF